MTYLLALLETYGVFAVFAWVLLAQAGIPVPAYPVLMVAGSLSAAGQLSMPGLVVAALLACLIADYGWYMAGSRYGGRVLRTLCKLSLTPDGCVNQTESVFDRWGPRSLIVAKFGPGFASVATAMAGATQVKRSAFMAYDAVGASLWAGIGLTLGWLFAPAVGVLLSTLESLGRWGLALLAVAIALYIARKAWARVNFQKYLRMQRLPIAELAALQRGGGHVVVLDVRKRAFWERERIAGSVPYELADWRAAAGHRHQHATVVAYCDCPAEASAAMVARALRDLGFTQAYPLGGGLESWRQAGLAIESGPVGAERRTADEARG